MVGWSNSPGAVYGLHAHPYDKVLCAVDGEIAFSVGATGRPVALRPGDRLDIPAHTPHRAVVGSHGVVCLEAQVPPRLT